jgi:radical SAM superfamily enzyme YgiQ (UPF0313 family)
MKILLVQPASNWHHPYCETPSIALLTLGTIARQFGHEVKIYHLDIDDIDLSAELKTFHPEIMGITCNTFQVKSAREIARMVIKESFDSKIIIGGPHAVAWKDEADIIVKGEGENRWLEILGEKPFDQIDDIPWPDYSLVDMSRFSGISPIGAIPSAAIMASRGCPGKCTFCDTPQFWGNKIRYRKPESVVNHISFLNKKYGMREVFIQDDTFNANQSWSLEIFARLISAGLHKKMVFRLACRANEKMVTDKFLNAAKRAGVWNIFYGIESGSQMMLDRMQKHITVEENKRAIRLTQEHGIQTQCSFIVGLPGETWQTIGETQTFIDETHPTKIGWGYACPFPGTEFDDEVTRKGHKLNLDYGRYVYGQLIVRTDELNYKDLESFKGFRNI